MIASATISAQKKEPNPLRAMTSKVSELAPGDRAVGPRHARSFRIPGRARRNRAAGRAGGRSSARNAVLSLLPNPRYC